MIHFGGHIQCPSFVSSTRSHDAGGHATLSKEVRHEFDDGAAGLIVDRIAAWLDIPGHSTERCVEGAFGGTR